MTNSININKLSYLSKNKSKDNEKEPLNSTNYSNF